MKKVLIISGSLRDGNSSFIAQRIFGAIKKKNNAEADVVFLSKVNIKPCNGCLICDNTGKCVFDDDMAAILEKVKNSDSLIIVSPTRWSMLSGELKVFFDRFNPLAGRGAFDGKKAFAISVGQTNLSSSQSLSKCLESIRFFLEDAGYEYCGGASLEDCYGSNDAIKKELEMSALIKTVCDFVDKL